MANFPEKKPDEREDLIAFLDGEMAEKQSQALEARLGRDPKLRQEVEALRKTWELLDFLPRKEPSRTFTSKTVERVSALHPVSNASDSKSRPIAATRVWIPQALWAAAIMAALGVGFGAGDKFGTRPGSSGPGWDSAVIQDMMRTELHLVENIRNYDFIEDLAFLRELADPDLFGDDS